MRFKNEIKEEIDKANQLIDSTKKAMNNHLISAQQVYDNLDSIQNSYLAKIESLINRENSQ